MIEIRIVFPIPNFFLRYNISLLKSEYILEIKLVSLLRAISIANVNNQPFLHVLSDKFIK